MRTPKNPFLLSGYHSPDYFCDRKAELSWLLDQFHNERNAVIYAHRRMGKTALIRHFFHHLEKKKQAQAIFIDLLGTTSMSEANKKLASAIVNQAGSLQGGIGKKMLTLLSSIGANIGMDPISGAPQVTFGLLQGPAVAQSMEAMGQYLKSLKRPVVIAIDEFQQVVNYSEDNAEAIFRSWTQEFPMIRFIFSGSHRHMMHTIFTDKNRPFYSSAQLLSLNPLDRSVYADFINNFFRKSKLKISSEILNQAFDWTRMQTYYVQLICNKLYGRAQNPDESLLNEIQQEILQQESPLFGTYQQLLTDFQWKTLKAIAIAESVANPTSQEFLANHQLGAASSVSTALNTLVKKEFVVQQEGYYSLHDTLLMRWLQQL